MFWLALMIPYSVFFFLVDSHVTWRVVRWFNAPELKFTSMLPIRASAYILSLVNEQVGKGAMTLYLLRHHKVPGLAGAVEHDPARPDGDLPAPAVLRHRRRAQLPPGGGGVDDSGRWT